MPGWSESQHPRVQSGENGGEFTAGGSARSASAAQAQKHKPSQAAFAKLLAAATPAATPAARAKLLAGMSDSQLKSLTAFAYSAKTSDKKIVAGRMSIAAEARKRGIDINQHGAGGGSSKKPAPRKQPTKKVDEPDLDQAGHHRKTAEMTITSVFGEITKTSPQEDGSLLVYGKATGSDIDLDQQRCDPEWLKKAMPEWMKIGNVREQHDSKRAVGKAEDHSVTPEGDHFITARVVDPIAKAKVEARILTGFSIGIKNARVTNKSAAAPNGVICDGSIIEVSLVDRPCLPTATLTLCKAASAGMQVLPADYDDERGLVRVEELTLAVDVDDTPALVDIDKVRAVVDADKAAEAAKIPNPADVFGKAGKPNPFAKKKDGEGASCDVEGCDHEGDCGGTPKGKEMPYGKKTADTDVEVEVEKATDVDQLDAPAPGMTCLRCTEPGHLWCAPEGFDRDFAVGLINQDLEKAASEAVDIAEARRAIGIIGNLIASEAAELAEKSEQAWDIRLLLQACSALHAFIQNEQAEEATPAGGSTTMPEMITLSEDPDGKIVGTPEEKTTEGDDHVKVYIGKTELTDLVNKAIEDALALVTNEVTPTDADIDKAAGAAPDTDTLVKAFTAVFADEDSDLRKNLLSIIEDSTSPAAEAVTELTARLEKVEQMAAPGGPNLRSAAPPPALKRDALVNEIAYYRQMERTAVDDRQMRDGYAEKAATAEHALKALALQ